MRFLLLPPVLTVLACSTSTSPADRENDAGADASYTTNGVYRCCAEGTGTACCEGTPQGTCFAYGDLFGRCLAAGESFDGKMPCAVCCDGLERFNADSACSPAPPSIFYCGKCGDGVCTEGENECTCPKDCALDAGEPRPR